MPTSILESIKLMLGVPTEYDVFDVVIMMHINSVFSTLHQLGVGPSGGYSITGAEDEWDDYIGEDKDLDAVKSYIYARVRLLFDPPQNAFLVSSLEKQIVETEWRLKVHSETSSEVLQNGT